MSLFLAGVRFGRADARKTRSSEKDCRSGSHPGDDTVGYCLSISGHDRAGFGQSIPRGVNSPGSVRLRIARTVSVKPLLLLSLIRSRCGRLLTWFARRGVGTCGGCCARLYFPRWFRSRGGRLLTWLARGGVGDCGGRRCRFISPAGFAAGAGDASEANITSFHSGL